AVITQVDTAAAAAHPGVVAVMTIDDLRAVGGMEAATVTKPLADGSVRFVGDPVVMVVAESRAVAEDACELVSVEYDPIEPVLDRPVKWIEDRYENLVAAAHARIEQAEVSLALDDDGTLLAIKADHAVDVGAYGGVGLNMVRFLGGPYRMRNVAGSSTTVKTN